MDANLYDEFGNYIGPELESEESEEEDEQGDVMEEADQEMVRQHQQESLSLYNKLTLCI